MSGGKKSLGSEHVQFYIFLNFEVDKRNLIKKRPIKTQCENSRKKLLFLMKENCFSLKVTLNSSNFVHLKEIFCVVFRVYKTFN